MDRAACGSRAAFDPGQTIGAMQKYNIFNFVARLTAEGGLPMHFRGFALSLMLLVSSPHFANAQTASTLNPEQRLKVYRVLIKEMIPRQAPDNALLVVGETPPASVELYAMPAYVVEQTPAAGAYKFTIWKNQVVLINGSSGKIEAVVRE
jgi:hypothetical protein